MAVCFSLDHQPEKCLEYLDKAREIQLGLVDGFPGDHRIQEPEGEVVRDGLNHWIRTSQVLDGYVDFDKATQDPQHPLQYLPQYDSGDHVHPSDAGYQVMANAIDLSM